jgi:hypothetical protein
MPLHFVLRARQELLPTLLNNMPLVVTLLITLLRVILLPILTIGGRKIINKNLGKSHMQFLQLLGTKFNNQNFLNQKYLK